MNKLTKLLSIAMSGTIITSCAPVSKTKKTEKTATNEAYIFPKGNKVSNGNFTGDVWVYMMVGNDPAYNSSIGSVAFAPGSRTNWHYHPGGQILLITSGKGLYQEKGKPVQSVKKGDVIKCPPGITHWHGASATDEMVHVAIGPNTDKGSVVWLAPVTDEEYRK